MHDFFENDVTEKLEKEKVHRQSNTLWCEKYRPLDLDSYVGNQLLKDKVSDYIKNNDIPHLLFFGKPGTGKTTLALILAKSINCDYIYINASSERGIDDVREKITSFAASAGFCPLKIIILDEADYLTPPAQAALRSVMETYSQTTRFILTCNSVERIVPAIRSRCQEYNLIPPSRPEVATHVYMILRKENVEATPGDIKLITDSTYPDIRRLINTLQQNTINGVLSIDKKNLIDSDFRLKILEELTGQSDKKIAFKNIRQILANNAITDFSSMFTLLYDKLDDYATGHIAQVILILADGQYKDALSVDHEINAMATITQILNEIKK